MLQRHRYKYIAEYEYGYVYEYIDRYIYIYIAKLKEKYARYLPGATN